MEINATRAKPRDILIWCTVRSVITEMAKAATGLNDLKEFDRFKRTLIGEIEAIKPGEPSTELWKQATTGVVEGVKAYGLERLGLWPGKEKEGLADALAE